MAIIKYPSFSVEIVIKEGDGVLNSATFSTGIDPASTNDMVVLRKKNINKKPFILGISNWGDDNYHYAANDYKGIATKGTGTGTVVSLTFSQPVDHFTLYFDEIANSMPTSITINSTTYSNDDYMFAYSQETASATFDITINSMNEINELEMPLMIVGIEAMVALFFDNKSGLRTIRSSNSFTSDKTKPSYGILSQEGALALFDYYTEIDDLIEFGLLKSDSSVDIYFEDNLVSKKTTRQWSELQANEFNVELSDRLIMLQDEMIESENIEFNKTAKYLYDKLVLLSPSLTFIIDETTETLLENIDLEYFYFETSTLWDAWNRLCELALLYMYMRTDGKVQIVSQDRIDELITLNVSNPIVIQYTRIDGTPKIERLQNNKIEKISFNKYDVSDYIDFDTVVTAYNSQENEPLIDNQSDTDTSGGGTLSSTAVLKTKYYSDTIIIQKKQNDGLEDVIKVLQGLDKNNEANIKHQVDYIYETGYVADFVSYKAPQYTTETNGSGQITNFSTINYSYATATATLPDDTNLQILNVQEHETYYEIQFKVLVGKETYGYTESAGIINSSEAFKYTPQKLEITVYGNKRVIEFNQGVINFGNDLSDKVFKFNSNKFIANTTSIDNENICEINATKILNKFTGKQSISFRMAIDNLYDKTGNLVYNINNGNILQVLDLIQLKKTDGTYDAKIWQVTKVEIEITGSKWANIEAIEI